MVSLEARNENLAEPVRPSQTWLPLPDGIDFRWSKEGTRDYAFQTLQRRLEADREARISGLMTFISPVLLNSIAAVLLLWFGQR